MLSRFSQRVSLKPTPSMKPVHELNNLYANRAPSPEPAHGVEEGTALGRCEAGGSQQLRVQPPERGVHPEGIRSLVRGLTATIAHACTHGELYAKHLFGIRPFSGHAGHAMEVPIMPDFLTSQCPPHLSVSKPAWLSFSSTPHFTNGARLASISA